MTGFVSFVSSGPGDPELLTLKAVARLQAADAVLFDDLSSGPILTHARPGADLVAVGKRAGRPSPKQDHVSRLLVDYARTGAKVVRLKSGDSGIFGRLEEEILALQAAGIGYEIIPGVPAACAAAAAAGIPLTRRSTARRLQFVTGADVTGHLPEVSREQAEELQGNTKRTETAADLRVPIAPPEQEHRNTDEAGGGQQPVTSREQQRGQEHERSLPATGGEGERNLLRADD